jgi:hypothetical protein
MLSPRLLLLAAAAALLLAPASAAIRLRIPRAVALRLGGGGGGGSAGLGAASAAGSGTALRAAADGDGSGNATLSCAARIKEEYGCSEEGCADLVPGYMNYILFQQCLVPAQASVPTALLIVIWMLFLLHCVESTTNE